MRIPSTTPLILGIFSRPFDGLNDHSADLQFETDTMYVHDLYFGIMLQIFSKTTYKYVQTAAKEVGVISPNHVQDQFASKYLVGMHAQEPQYLRFFFGELSFFGRMAQLKIAVIERVLAQFELVPVAWVVRATMRAA